ncbi:MAG: glutathione S-transferase [Myxococcales bacterium]|nr:glutathione S-transferase [Myxococcales bacterium]
MPTPILFRHPLSGHSHRAQLMLCLLGIAHELRDVALAEGAHKRPEFLALNPFGQVPVLVDGDAVIADSNAILVYLATRHDPGGRWYPEAAGARAGVQRWLSVAAGELARGPAAARLVTVFGARLDHDDAKARARALLELLDRALDRQPFLAGDAPTIADVALYTYTAHAPEGGVSLAPHPATRSWLARVEALAGFVPMRRSPVGVAA